MKKIIYRGFEYLADGFEGEGEDFFCGLSSIIASMPSSINMIGKEIPVKWIASKHTPSIDSWIVGGDEVSISVTFNPFNLDQLYDSMLKFLSESSSTISIASGLFIDKSSLISRCASLQSLAIVSFKARTAKNKIVYH